MIREAFALPRRPARAGTVWRLALAALCALCATAFVAPAAHASTAPTYNTSFDGTGTPDGSMTPTKLSVDESTGDVYVIDSAHDVVNRFAADGTYLSQLSGSDTDAGSFSFGLEDDIAVDNSGGTTQGNVYVVSETALKAFAFDSTGRFLWQADFSGGPDICGVAVDASGRPYVADYFNRVVELNPSTGAAVLSIPVFGASPCEMAFDTAGLYLTAYHGKVSLFSFDPDTTTYNEERVVDAGFNFDVTVDGLTGDVFTVRGPNDTTPAELTMYDAQGNAATGSPFGGPDAPAGVTADGTGRKLFVANSTDSAIDVYDLIPLWNLTVTTDGTGSGSVTCDGDVCADSYLDGTSVTLDATADAHSTFTGWNVTGDGTTTCTGTTSPCTVTMGADVDVTATFAQDVPTATTGSASSITQTGATLSGTVNPNGAATTCTFEYGTTTAYGSSAPCSAAVGSGTSGVAVSASVTGLAAGTTYHFRVVARNAGGTTNGADQTFTTDAATLPPPRTCATDPTLCPVVTPGVLKLDVAVAIVKKGKAAVKLSCVGDTACADDVKIVVKVKVRKHGKKVTKKLTIGKAHVEIDAGGHETVKVKLTKAGKKLLAKKHRLKARLVGDDINHALVLKQKT